MSFQVEIMTAAEDFLAVAGDHLAANPVLTTVIATMANRVLRSESPLDSDNWWLVVKDQTGTILGTAMRQSPRRTNLGWLGSMPPEAAAAAATAVHHQVGSPLDHLTGDIVAVGSFARRWAELTNTQSVVGRHTRLFEAPQIIAPTPPPGLLRLPRTSEVALLRGWFDEFQADADAQGGHQPSDHPDLTAAEISERIAEERLWVWAVDDQPVHMTGHNLPSFGVARVGPVFTPAGHRGRGYAGQAVAQISQRILENGHRVCLFTDQANPISNALYERLGYRALTDMIEMRLRPN